jgi:hypothetical protein
VTTFAEVVDPRPNTRAFIAEQLNFSLHHGDMARTCAEIGDDVGLEHHVRRLVEYVKAAASSTREIVRDSEKIEAEKRGHAA